MCVCPERSFDIDTPFVWCRFQWCIFYLFHFTIIPTKTESNQLFLLNLLFHRFIGIEKWSNKSAHKYSKNVYLYFTYSLLRWHLHETSFYTHSHTQSLTHSLRSFQRWERQRRKYCASYLTFKWNKQTNKNNYQKKITFKRWFFFYKRDKRVQQIL